MFNNKKVFPVGTFIPKWDRVLAILHLCLVFTLISWCAGYPFMGELYSIKSKKMLYESVLGKGNPESQQKFEQLSIEKQREFQQDYARLQAKSKTPLSSKLAKSWKIMAIYLSPFMKAWILFSILIPILILIKIEGARTAAWILPVIVLFYSWNNLSQGYIENHVNEHALFPSEEQLVAQYLDEPLSSDITTQQEQLMQGWQQYLADHWGDEHHFQVARIEARKQDGDPSLLEIFRGQESPLLLLVYFGWNLLFAWQMNRKPVNQ